jgi:ribulose-phosphate 3-epimerase
MQKVVPAILTADPAELQENLKVLKDHTKWVHVDIMDGRFVPNTSVNLFELGEAYRFFNLEIHLMVEHPEKYFSDCKEIGAKRVIFHAEATDNIAGVLEEMEKYPFQRAIGINPKTPVSMIASYIEKLDSVLLMSVHPGFQAQEFVGDVLSKIPEIRKIKPDITIGLDGGINETNIKNVFEAGADYADVGSAVMKAEDPTQSLTNLGHMVI